jgi:hypothetical protein
VSVRADVATLVERTLIADAAACDVALEIGTVSSRRWASATFVGARVVIEVAGPAGTAALRWISALPEAEFAIRGHLMADIAVTRHERGAERFAATVELLMLEER